MTDANPEPVDTADAEDAKILLADPDDYHRAQRLREIHDARRKVADQVHDLDVSGRGKVTWESVTKLAHAVAVYAEEILALRKQMDHGPLELPEGCHHDTVEEYAITMGSREASDGTNEPAGPNHAMVVYRTCNDFLADVKPLLEEDDTDQWEV